MPAVVTAQKTLSVFYDDAHFTNEGTRVVAEKVYEYLNSAPVPKESSRTPSIVTCSR